MLKKIISVVLVTAFFLVSCPASYYAEEIANSSTTETFAHIIEWRFKQINGVWHKRQYDCTAQKWIGSWVPV